MVLCDCGGSLETLPSGRVVCFECDMEKPQTTAARQAKFKSNQRKLGRRRAEYWVTDEERRELDALLARLRSSNSGRR